MLNKEQQVKNSLIYLLPPFVGNLIPIITLPIFTRILSKEDFGAYALAQVYGFFVTGCANFGLRPIYERNFFQYDKAPQKTSALLYSTILFVVATLIFFLVVTLFFRHPIARFIIGSENYSKLLFLTFCSSAIMSLKIYYLAYFKSIENAKSFSWYTIDEYLIGFVISFVLVVILKIGVLGLPYGQLVASIVVLLLLTCRFLKSHPFAFDWQLLKDILKISYPLTPQIFIGVIGSQFDKYMLGLLNSVGGVGVYSIGQKIANAVFIYMTAIQNVFSPQVYKRMFNLGDKGGESIGRYLTPFAYVSTALALVVALFSEEIIMLLTPPPYHGAIDVVAIFAMYYSFLFFGKQPQLLYSKKTFITSMLTIGGLLLNVAINIPFIKMWGVAGAAWGSLLSGLLFTGVAFVVSQKYYRIEWEFRKLIPIYLILSVATILMIALRHTSCPYILRLSFKLFMLSIYTYLGVKLRVLTLANFNLLKSFIPSGLKLRTSLS